MFYDLNFLERTMIMGQTYMKIMIVLRSSLMMVFIEKLFICGDTLYNYVNAKYMTAWTGFLQVDKIKGI